MNRLRRIALASAPLVCAAFLPSQTIAVQNVTPAGNAVLSPMQPIAVTFSAPVAQATVTAQSFALFGRWSGVVPGGISFDAASRVATFQPSRPLFVGEFVTLTIANTVRGAANEPLAHGWTFQWYVATAPGSRQFVNQQTIQLRRPGEGRIATYGIHAGDVDRDGAPDITAMNEMGNDIRVLFNDGCGGFGALNVVPNPGEWPSPSESADLDRDGWMDLVTGDQNGQGLSVYRNTGAGMYGAPVVYPVNGYVHGVTAGDFDGDGYWDLAVTNQQTVQIARNDGSGQFTFTGSYDVGNGEDPVAAIDANEDGILDLAVGCFNGSTVVVLLGDGVGGFTPGPSRSAGGSPFHVAAGDANGDGHVDVAFSNRGSNTLGMLLGTGAGAFQPVVTYPVGNAPAAIDFGDLDGDGDLDCVVANYGSSNFTLWWNRGDAVFENAFTLPAPQSGSCSTLVDFDRDGVLDVIGTDENVDVSLLYRQVPVATIASTQPPTCGAALRIDNRADRAGFGHPPQGILGGRLVSFGVSGPPQLPVFVAIGFPQPAGLQLFTWGTLNLDQTQPITSVWNGLLPGGPALDGNGEVAFTLRMPFGFNGITVAFQGAVATLPDLVLTNAQTIVLQ